jgi:glycosyltransferase involved in cell wall biosynthesis
LNGGLPWPREFAAARRKEREWLSSVRALHKLLPGYRAMRARAAAILIGSLATWEQMSSRYRDKCVYMPENGIDPARFPTSAEPFHGLPLRVAFVGRLVPYKGADMLIEAAADLVRAGKVELEILGDGPERHDLEALVRCLGLGSRVAFAGWVGHTDLHSRLSRSHVLGFPSIREFGGGVVLEAMALGVVPIVVDYGGPAELITPETGFTVPLGSHAEIVRGLRAHLEDLVEHPRQIAPKSAAARSRAMEFSWTRKASCLIEVYRWVLGQRPEKPAFDAASNGQAPTRTRVRLP